MPDGAGRQSELEGLVGTSDVIASTLRSLAEDHPGTGKLFERLRPIPGNVPTLSVGKDTLRWNPAFVRSLLPEELRFVLAAACLHRAAAHPLRQEGRDPGLWGVACEIPVNHLLVSRDVETSPDGAFYNPRSPASIPAEAVYERIRGRQHHPEPMLRFEPWKGDPPASLPSVEDVAEGIVEHDFDCMAAMVAMGLVVHLKETGTAP